MLEDSVVFDFGLRVLCVRVLLFGVEASQHKG